MRCGIPNSILRHRMAYRQRIRLRRWFAAKALSSHASLMHDTITDNKQQQSIDGDGGDGVGWSSRQWEECHQLVHDKVAPLVCITSIKTNNTRQFIEWWPLSSSSSAIAGATSPIIIDRRVVNNSTAAARASLDWSIRRRWQQPEASNPRNTASTIQRYAWGATPDHHHSTRVAANNSSAVSSTSPLTMAVEPSYSGFLVESILASSQSCPPRSLSTTVRGMSLQYMSLHDEQWMTDAIEQDATLPYQMRLINHHGPSGGFTTLWSYQHDVLQRTTTTIVPSPRRSTSSLSSSIDCKVVVTDVRASQATPCTPSVIYPHAHACGTVIWCKRMNTYQLLTPDLFFTPSRRGQLYCVATAQVIKRAPILHIDPYHDNRPTILDATTVYDADGTSIMIALFTKGHIIIYNHAALVARGLTVTVSSNGNDDDDDDDGDVNGGEDGVVPVRVIPLMADPLHVMRIVPTILHSLGGHGWLTLTMTTFNGQGVARLYDHDGTLMDTINGYERVSMYGTDDASPVSSSMMMRNHDGRFIVKRVTRDATTAALQYSFDLYSMVHYVTPTSRWYRRPIATWPQHKQQVDEHAWATVIWLSSSLMMHVATTADYTCTIYRINSHNKDDDDISVTPISIIYNDPFESIRVLHYPSHIIRLTTDAIAMVLSRHPHFLPSLVSTIVTYLLD